jgi:uncharacterized protein
MNSDQDASFAGLYWNQCPKSHAELKGKTMPKARLSDAERLILINQHEIMAILKPDERDHHQQIAEAIRAGDETTYQEHLQLNETQPNLEEHAEFVLTILEIYDDLKYSASQLENQSRIDPDKLIFPGFHASQESDLMAYADAQRGKYPSVLYKAGNNSQVPMTEKYQAMIGKWNELGQPRTPLNQETVLEILNAG